MTEEVPAHNKRHRFPAEIIAHALWLSAMLDAPAMAAQLK
jgi:hypothetical protein